MKKVQQRKQLSFEIYLKYGGQFIIRNKSAKYTFVSREQLIQRIHEVSSQNRGCLTLRSQRVIESSSCDDYHISIPSANMIDNYYTLDKPPSTHSDKPKELLMVIPRTVSFYNMLHRFANYPLLLYHTHEQLRYFARHVGKSYHATILIEQQGLLNIQKNHSNI